MIRVAVVEDEQAAYESLNNHIQRFQQEQKQTFSVTHFGNAECFLSVKDGSFDLVFMDIELSGMDGLEASRRFREQDSTAVLIFVTNMAQYAIKGYEVDALDFVVKPVSYQSFRMKLQKALRHIRLAEETHIALPTKTGIKRIPISKIRYVEVRGHRLSYHTADGIIDGSGALSEAERLLDGAGFSRCNNCYLVNLGYVSEVRSNEVMVDGESLTISRSRRKGFMEDLARRIGE